MTTQAMNFKAQPVGAPIALAYLVSYYYSDGIGPTQRPHFVAKLNSLYRGAGK